jgi:transposase
MASKQEALRERVVQFYNLHLDKTKKFTVDHFAGENVPKSTVYFILQKYSNRGDVKRKAGSGRPVKIMTAKKMKLLKYKFDHKDKVSQQKCAKELKCTQQYVSHVLKNNNIKKFKKKKAPFYRNEEAINLVRKQCRWLCRTFKNCAFIIDDEKYFTLRNYNQSGNGYFYSSNKSLTPGSVKFKFKQKYEQKIMLYIAISSNGVSKPYFCLSKNAIHRTVYINKCLKKILLPFIKKYHSDDKYIFWPDKASAHYAQDTQKYLNTQNVHFVAK